MKRTSILGSFVFYCLWASLFGRSESILWEIDNLESIDGNTVLIQGRPTVVDGSGWKAVEFDGDGDCLIVDSNPLDRLDTFTIEVVFRPDPGGAVEQRFFHVQQDDDHRALIETRLTQDGKWFLDTFIKSGESEKTLYAEEYLHRLGQWAHAALVYDGSEMRHYVNGSLELSGSVSFSPMAGGQTSVGCRLNRVYWFKGAIKVVRVDPLPLSPERFRLLGDSAPE